jgi:hypothetical protein
MASCYCLSIKTKVRYADITVCLSRLQYCQATDATLFLSQKTVLKLPTVTHIHYDASRLYT